MSSARDRIADYIWHQMCNAVEWDRAGVLQKSDGKDAVPAIIAIVRQALLADDAVEAGAWSLWCDKAIEGSQYEETHYPASSAMLEAALDAAFGKEGE